MAKGQNTARHPGRGVPRERFANTEVIPPHPAGPGSTSADDDYEPDYEGMMERKLERRRPEGDTW